VRLSPDHIERPRILPSFFPFPERSRQRHYLGLDPATVVAGDVTAETVGGSLPLSDERLLHGRNSGRKTQFVWSDY
jgi:hypothetical protein